MEKQCHNCKFWKVQETADKPRYTNHDGLLIPAAPAYGYCTESSSMSKELVPEEFGCPKWKGNFLFG